MDNCTPESSHELVNLAYATPQERRERLVDLQDCRTELTSQELEWGARLAWRNSARCIGRLTWSGLQVRDLRGLDSQEAVFQACLEHILTSTNGGRIIPTISVFARRGPRILNSQLIRYADDPEQASFLQELERLGWRPNRERYELLPLAIAWEGRPTLVRPLPRETVLEVELHSSTCPALSQLGLRWHALPAMADRVLEIAGRFYPCAPFSGWYMGTEIAARNLGDRSRYNLLPQVAEAMGLQTGPEKTLWRDRALVELNAAVIESFEKAGVSLVDHHTASRQFLHFMAKESELGRPVNADWSWIVPPISASQTEVFHTPMSVRPSSPAFLSRAEAGLENSYSAKLDAPQACPYS